MKAIKDILFSWFNPPVSNTKPAKSVTLEEVYQVIESDSLKSITEKIRSGKAKKGNVLPSVTFSGTFSCRSKTGLLEYSNLIVFDIDKQDFASTLKWRISIDVFLKVVLAFISPRGKGLKIIIRVKDGNPEEHELYFKAVVRYVKAVFGIEIDESGKDISRLCFLCWDPATYYNPDGYVERESLLRLLPKESFRVSKFQSFRKEAGNAESKIGVSQTVSSNTETDQTAERPSDLLNRLPEIHELAVQALKRTGWKPSGDPKGERITRPHKAVKDGCSAIYNLWDQEGIWIMTVFSNRAHPFKAHKGYSDVQIICLLDYNDDWTACITDLASRYLEPV